MQVTDAPIRLLTVYGRTYCHLCDDMIAALHTLQGRFSFELTVVDVDTNPEVETRFGDKVPVLMYGDRELCHYFMDEPIVSAVLSDLR
jgi:glutaredoxin